MSRFKSLIINALFIILTGLIEAKPPELNPQSTHKKSEEIFQAHVSHKKLTPELAKRIFQNYVDELDPTKTYFVENEVLGCVYPSEKDCDDLIQSYKDKEFTIFESTYSLMVKAIDRRNRIESEIEGIALPEVSVSEFKDLKWAKNEEELKQRLLKLRALQLDTAEKLGVESKDQFFKRIAKYRFSKEKEMIQDGPKNQQKQALAYFLKAFASALDNNTVYFTPSEASQFMIQIQQRLFGIGAQLRDDLNGFTLVRLLEGGPAIKGGKLKSGDRIIAVNQEPVVGMDIVEAVELIRGPKGTPVSLTILRELGEEQGKSEKFEIEIVRDEIVLKESRFESELIPYGNGVIGHIRLFSFYQDQNASSASDIKEALEKIKAEHELSGVILDLRSNGGGILPQAVAVSGLFIKKGIVVSIKDSEGHIQHLRNFEGTPVWDGPLIVLSNKASASSAEIVAQTLQDYGRALLIGDPYTWGKGSYQTPTFDFSNKNKINPQGEYKVTRGLYYTASGKSPQLTGAKADIVVPGALAESEVGESETKFPLENDEISPNFTDELTDIHPFHRGKMMRLYSKDRQEKLSIHEPYLQTLRINSENRIEKNKNYQNFLKEMRKKEFEEETVEHYGLNDLQLEETVNIMKDLIFISKENQVPAKAA